MYSLFKKSKGVCKASVLLFLFILLSVLVFASDVPPVEVTYKILNNSIEPGGWAKFHITIRNNKVADDTFIVKVPEEGTKWSSISQPPIMLGNEFMILGGRAKTFTLFLKDKDLPRVSGVPVSVALNVKSKRDGKDYVTLLPVFLLSGDENKRYTVNISVSAAIPAYVDPRNSHSFKFNIVNNNARQYDNLSLKVESLLIKEEVKIELLSDAAKAVDFTIPFSKDLPPMKDTVFFEVYDGEVLIYEGSEDYEIVSYDVPFVKEEHSEESFFKITEEITLTNDMNSLKEQEFLVEAPFFRRIVSKTIPEAEIVEKEGITYFSWMVKLEHGKSENIVIVENNRIYLYVAVLVGFIVFLFIMFRDPITINQHPERVTTKHGGIVEIKIVLYLKNRSSKNFDNTRLIQRVPHMLHYVEKHEHGTVVPDSKVINQRATVLTWNLDIDAHEERIITYYLKSKLNILGGVTLPPVLVKIKMKNNHVTIKSNSLHIATDN